MLWNEKSWPWRVPVYWILTLGSGAGTFHAGLYFDLPELVTVASSYLVGVGVLVLCLRDRDKHPAETEKYPDIWFNLVVIISIAMSIISTITQTSVPSEIWQNTKEIFGALLFVVIVVPVALTPFLLFGVCLWIGSKFGWCHWPGWHWREF